MTGCRSLADAPRSQADYVVCSTQACKAPRLDKARPELMGSDRGVTDAVPSSQATHFSFDG